MNMNYRLVLARKRPEFRVYADNSAHFVIAKRAIMVHMHHNSA